MIPAPIASERVAGSPCAIWCSTFTCWVYEMTLPREDVLHREQVLVVDRLVEAPRVPDRGDRLRRRGPAGQAHRRIAVRDRLEDQEGQHRDREQHHDASRSGGGRRSGPSVPQPDRGVRVERVANAVAEDVDAEHGEHEHRARARASGGWRSGAAGCRRRSSFPTRGSAAGRPRRDRTGPASSRIALAIISGMNTMIVEARFGSISLHRMRMLPSPWSARGVDELALAQREHLPA